MNKKRIIVISTDFSLEAGGIQNTSYLLAEYLSAYFEIITICSSTGNIPKIEGVSGYRNKYTIKKPLSYAISCINIIRKISKVKPVDYILALDFYNCLCGPLLKIINGVPYGLLTHGNEVIKYTKIDILHYPKWLFNIYLNRTFILKFADHIFANTFFTKSLVEQLTDNQSVYVVSPPICILPKQNPMTKNGIILSIGRLVERKGFQNVIKALPQILKFVPNLKYYIAGIGEYESELKSLAKALNLDNNVRFLGRVSEGKKVELLEKCDLMIMPSFAIWDKGQVEGFGLTFIEANAYGKFVIGSRSGGVSEAIKDGETGFLVKENDVEDIIKALLRFYDEEFCYDTIVLNNWAKNFHISKVAKQYSEIISKLI